MFLFPRAEDRSPWGDFWFTPLGSRSSSGLLITPDNAMRHSAVYACIRVLSETMAMLPFLLSQVSNGKRTYVTDHWLYRLMAKRPNTFQNAFEWREMMMGHLALRGNAFNRIIANAVGEVEQLIPLHPDRVELELASDGGFRYRVRSRDGTTEILPRGMVWHIKGLSSDGYMGLSPVELAKETIGLGLSVQEYGSRFFQNDARPGGGWIEHPTQFKNKESRDIFKESWQGAQTGVNRHKTAVLEWGMKYHDLPIKNNDSQFLETRGFQVVDICRIFRVPPHLVADLTRGTFSNIEHQSLEFMAYSMAPWAERFEASLEYNFLPDDEGWEVEYDFTNLMRGDAASRSTYYQTGINAGWLTRNEAREAEGYEPLDGLDDPLTPLNMSATGAPPRPAGSGEPPDSSSADPQSSAPHLALIVAERMIRKEIALVERSTGAGAAAKVTEFYAGHARFIAEAFGGNPQAAKLWCDEHLRELLETTDLTATLNGWKATGARRLAELMSKP